MIALSALHGVELALSLRLVAAVILGACIGLERSLAGKHAGMRTYAMVALGSALFCIVGTLAAFELQGFSGINPMQIAGSVVVGIGFIGSGLAAFRGEHPVEITTASGIWVVASIGMACGFGLYVLAVAGTLLSVVIFSALSRIEHTLRTRWGVE